MLGVLFVALSLRLCVVQARMLTHVRDFATVSLSTLLVAIVIAVLDVARVSAARLQTT